MPFEKFEPDTLLTEHVQLFSTDPINEPVLDLACGDGQNGIFLASRGVSVILADRSEEALKKAGIVANELNVQIKLWLVDFEQAGVNPFENRSFSGIIVFRYLHRPLMHCIRKAIGRGGILIYETFTESEAGVRSPSNPDHLLKAGELRKWFKEWEIIYYYEGLREDRQRAVAQIVCRKP
jgi:SAM-dependent methyltransferase